MDKKLFALVLVLFSLASVVRATQLCCNSGPSCTCSAEGSCTYACVSGHYNCDSNSENGCENATPCNHYTFQRYTFNLSSYTISNIAVLTYCFEGYYSATGYGSAILQYYNTTSASWWNDTQNTLGTSSSVLCRSFTNPTQLVSNNIFQFAVRGYTGDYGYIGIYADNVNLSLQLQSAGGNPVVWYNGKYGSAVNFSGSNYIEASDSSSLNITDQITVEAWIKTGTTAPAYQTIVQKANSTSENYGLYLQGHELYFEWIGSTSSIATTTANLQPETWYHVAAVFNYPTSLALYINGVQKATSSPSSNLVTDADTLRIGGNKNGTANFTGTIDEVAIYSRAKSADEIAADANPLYISTTLRDSLNNQISIRGSNSGYVNAGANNTFCVKTSSGSLNMTVGAYSGLYSLRAYANNTQVNVLTTIIESGVSSIQAILPIQLGIYQQTFSSLIIAEK